MHATTVPSHRRRRTRRRLVLTATLLAFVALAALALPRTTDVPGLVAHLGASIAAPSPTMATALDPELERRFEQARRDAADQGVELRITSGWRSADEQQALIDQTLARYGDEAEAHRWVAPVDGSSHVTGRAIDVGPTEGAYWLAEHGADYGLCQVYANEMWHFEIRTEPGGRCPAVVADASGLWH